MDKFILNTDKRKAWLKNILKFTAPLLAIFFAQLALGVDIRDAGLIVLFSIYGLLADYFKKLK